MGSQDRDIAVWVVRLGEGSLKIGGTVYLEAWGRVEVSLPKARRKHIMVCGA